ncbi:MAG: pilus assembly protein TadG-related protein [Gammaproteobacteria bacterium]|nr:pilus assembly protein TadG-related protein [Gammaproteobacteria bacterium]
MTGTTRRFRSPPKRQDGIIVVIVAIGAAALLGAGALAFDVGHVILSKTRLQNSVDAAALSGAKEIDISGDTAQAAAAARDAFEQNALANGNHDLLEYFNDGGAVDVQFSATLHPFVPATEPPEYVRVRVNNLPLDTWLASIVGITEKSVAATAVAGPSPPLGPESEACNLAPMMICGDPEPDEGTNFGYILDDLQVLKTSAQNGNFDVGPGNFQLVRLDGGQGAADIRAATAGGFGACLSDDEDIETEPGNTVGPVAQGMNTRFGIHTGVMNGTEDIYPPDVVTTENSVEFEFDQNGHLITQIDELDFTHQMYTQRSSDGLYDHTPAPDGPGHFERRVMAVPIGDCTETTTGHGFVPLLGYACFFLLQRVSHQGNESHIYGQFVEGCRARGRPGPDPGDSGTAVTSGPHIIQLYEDPNSTDS